MLDEIINYVQSLQRQVEVNPSFSRTPFFSVIANSKISFLAVSFNEIGDRESKDGFQRGCSFVEGCKFGRFLTILIILPFFFPVFLLTQIM